MASHNLLHIFLPLLFTLLDRVFAFDISNEERGLHPFTCTENRHRCDALLYHINKGQQIEQIAAFYTNSTQITPILHKGRQDYLVTVPCSCKTINHTTAYFYDATYRVKENDTFFKVSDEIYSGQAWEVGNETETFKTGYTVPMHLLCGCVERDSQIVVTYTVQQQDILSDIATRLSSTINGIQGMSGIPDPNIIQPGWVLFVPKEINGIPPPNTESGKRHKWAIIIGILSAVTLLLMTTLIIGFLRTKGCQRKSEEDLNVVSKSMSTTRGRSLQILNMEIMEGYFQQNEEKRTNNVLPTTDGTAFESEKPVIYTPEEIEEATNNFDETKKIGTGGYGSVYFGVMGRQEVAIKKMKSNKSKEFIAEVKILCKVHHINVVELLGFASGDDHLYLVYEYIRNGSLSDHLHDPLLQGYQPLSWTARTQIAFDAAKGIEYIHDHTKKRYVHRDIKSSNILLDEGLRAKVADFGLAKLIERTHDEDLIATRLVGTPGYLPPETKGCQRKSEEDLNVVSKSMSTTRGRSLQILNMEIMEGYFQQNEEKRTNNVLPTTDGTAFESEKPVIYTPEEIEEATNNFDETKKIGTGGYGSVYFGVMGRQEVAIKKMKSNKSKEFIAEVKILCKVHHINVVELLGFASGDDHLYLVYEYIRNGSLSDHLHDPLLQGYQPLSWTARTQIAFDAAKGIEYIHDHTKKRYVHRDIKSSNILLDEGLRAKVADFGLAKLIERTHDEDLIATRLVGTPGYLPPESVKELHVTTKTDVFAFGVLLAELITGQRALLRDNWEPTKMRSLITVVYKIFEDEDPESALENAVDRNLRGSFPMDDVYKMAEIAECCLNEDPINRPEMRDIVPKLSKIMTSSVEWEASLGGNSPVFSGLYSGR
ncbi:hypothetical protein JCGZ_17799 [Jatropha curcas]|uniref:non-specific serine/threonine protein kinase n=1 Tax=Jatropha curcas TaxID=180498 RepID=A0A067JRR0_JATCU|nr:hypothetical protein JCGZ_17799 [Jatropha curcas]